MDPYLEQSWGDVHARLTTYTCDQLNPRLPGDLIARVEEYVALAAPEESAGRFVPDVTVTESPQDGPPAGVTGGSGIAVPEPVLVRVPGSRTGRRVLTYEVGSGNRVVTAVEVLSPWNKVGEEGRSAYRRKRREFLSAGVSVVEVDLLRGGQYVLYPPEGSLPPDLREPYRVCAVRGWARSTAEVYRLGLRGRLPAVRVPLRRADPDVALDLQALIDLAYQNGRYGQTLDYKRDAEPALTGDDAAWADALLKAAGKR
jgi:hypothetical protein